MIRNEKYVGDLLTGKTYTDNPINSKKKKNKGEFDMYYTEDHQTEYILTNNSSIYDSFIFP